MKREGPKKFGHLESEEAERRSAHALIDQDRVELKLSSCMDANLRRETRLFGPEREDANLQRGHAGLKLMSLCDRA